MVFFGVALVAVAVYLIFRPNRADTRRAPLWDCGFEKMTKRMQYTATSFFMPTRRVFGPFFGIREGTRVIGLDREKVFPGRVSYSLRTRDRLFGMFYLPVSGASFWIARRFGRLQHGKIHIYLLFSFITLVVLLVFSR
jgi:hypothetical protein